ncbi:carboxylesterase family protein [Rothia sp. 88186D007BW]
MNIARLGETIKAAHYYRGIPYARAERFASPRPLGLENLPADFTATDPAPAAPQHVRPGKKGMRQTAHLSEDCQNLTIVTPAGTAPGENLPVMVFFHGGSYIYGSGDGQRYDPYLLVIEHRLIVVKVTHRLGYLGFMGGTPSRPANLGLLDARQALRWVQRHIADFGGDPDRVTAFGQSAGGDLVARLMITDGVAQENLFQQAIIQSAPLHLIHGKDAMTRHLLTATQGIPQGAPAQTWGEAAHKHVMANPFRFGLDRAMMPFGCQYGHYPLPAEEDEDAAYRAVAGKFKVLVGSMERESGYFTPHLTGRAGRAQRAVLDRLICQFSRRLYAQPARHFAQRHQDAGGQALAYQLATGAVGHPMESVHCTDLALLFDNPIWEGSSLWAGADRAQQQTQGEALRAIWAGFAHTGQYPREHFEAARLREIP